MAHSGFGHPHPGLDPDNPEMPRFAKRFDLGTGGTVRSSLAGLGDSGVGVEEVVQAHPSHEWGLGNPWLLVYTIDALFSGLGVNSGVAFYLTCSVAEYSVRSTEY
ncbi:hypothetical protein N7492_001390 [Penicillium capsulatum]|uniref:Uncharacterized protein n=1 Tax=Penicillium capsulatum TaxID=69766 RepID=A0A9W9M098_9EURO|nr:hypothetical protein N7492_001390 [Penicillium capsulatum]KAJ6129556.1 hypothetical protein N7512_002336 [Penicillium capsulatum]